jgi:hypothetical protein
MRYKKIDMENKEISAFAFNTGRLIEDLINKETSNLKHTNQMLEAKILDFYCKIKDMDSSELYNIEDTYRDYFSIKINTGGN